MSVAYALRLLGLLADQSAHQHLLREVVPWHQLRHPNITPFIGYTFTEVFAELVSEWEPNGNLRENMPRSPADGLRIVSNCAAIHCLFVLKHIIRYIRRMKWQADWRICTVGVHRSYTEILNPSVLIHRHSLNEELTGPTTGEHSNRKRWCFKARGFWTICDS